MSTLAELNARLQAIIAPAGQDQPTSAQYDQAIKEAVRDFGYRCPIEKQVTLSVLQGQAQYTLPADFVRLIDFPDFARIQSHGIIITGQGIIPVGGFYTERVFCRNGKLTLYPTPSYSLDRTLSYAAGFPFVESDGDGTFTDLDDDEASIVLHKAASLILLVLADGCARLGWSYSLADESVDKKQLAATLNAQSDRELVEYQNLIQARRGVSPQTTQADYGPTEYGTFAEDIP